MSEMPESYDSWKLASPDETGYVEEVDEFGRTREEYEADLADSLNDELWFSDWEDFPTSDPDFPEIDF
jgi:hypothetical protein